MFDNPAGFIEPEDVDSGPGVIARPILAAMEDDTVTLRQHAKELDALAEILARRVLDIVDEALLAVGDAGTALDVGCPGVPLDRLTRAAPIEHQVVELRHGPLVALQTAFHAGLRSSS